MSIFSAPILFIYSVLYNILGFARISDATQLADASNALLWASVFIAVGMICLFIYFGYKLLSWFYSLFF